MGQKAQNTQALLGTSHVWSIGVHAAIFLLPQKNSRLAVAAGREGKSSVQSMFLSVHVTRINRKSLACVLAVVGLFFLAAEAAVSSTSSDAELAAITERGVLLAEYDTAACTCTCIRHRSRQVSIHWVPMCAIAFRGTARRSSKSARCTRPLSSRFPQALRAHWLADTTLTS